MEEDEIKRPSHISYKEYQKKVNEKPKDGIIIFVSAFFILLLLFLGIAKQITPDVDVTISDENSKDMKSEVDERLKILQMEDNNEMFSPELDEKVVIPDFKKAEEEQPEEKAEQPEEKIQLTETEATPKPEQTADTSQTAKVVVGYYSTKEQAEVAKGILSESGLNITPFVRSIGGAYTIQVGSFSGRDKAQGLANELLRNNYPARIITE